MQNPDWHPEDIKAAIRKTGVTVSQLSIKCGYDQASFRVAFRRPWPAVERLIADHLRRQPWTIWPSRYDSRHKPIKRAYVRRTDQAKSVANHNAVVSA